MPRRPPSSRARWNSLPGAEPAGTGVAAVAALAALRAYRIVLAPVLPPSCRFFPTCSAFAVEAVERHGARRGLYLALRRVGRCHPWNPGGYDPVPVSEH